MNSFNSWLVSATSPWPRRVQVIRNRGANHLHAPDLSIFDEERFCYENTRRPVESAERVLLAGGQNSGVDGSLIEDHVRPDNTAFLIHDGVTSVVNVLHNEVVAELEL